MKPKSGWSHGFALVALAFVLAMTFATVALADDYAPYTAGPVVREVGPFEPYTVSDEPYAPYTAGPVVNEEEPYAPYPLSR